MKSIIVPLLLLVLFLIGCSNQREITLIDNESTPLLKEFMDLNPKSRIQITDSLEAGEQLSLCVYVVNKQNNEPIVDQEIETYHTNNDGEYNPTNPEDESTARLSGKARTDSAGRVYISTILPGDYGSSTDNRHIHTTIPSAKPQAYDIYFRQYSTWMNRRFVKKSNQHFLAELYLTSDGLLVGFVTIEISN